MIQSNIGNYLKQIIVSQGYTIKGFAELYGTKEPYMGEILNKKDVSTSVIRKIESALNTSFTLSCELDNILNNEPKKDEARSIPKKSGRPISFSVKDSTTQNSDYQNYIVFQKEIEGLREQLRLKDDIIESKNELIEILKTTKK